MSKKLILAIILILMFSGHAAYAEGTNLVSNPGFEDGSEEKAAAWDNSPWDKNAGAAEFRLDDSVRHSGDRSMLIINSSPNDSRVTQEIKAAKSSYYKLSCWIRTENAGTGEGSKGANISVEGILDTSKDIKGTSGEWEYVELYGQTGADQDKFILTLGLGGYGRLNTGKAWFDDISVEKVGRLPAGTDAAKLFADKAPESAGSAGPAAGGKEGYGSGMMSYTFIYLMVYGLIILLVIKGRIRIPSGREKACLYGLLFAGLALRLALARTVEGMPNDIACFKGWAMLAADDLPGMYNKEVFLDYPPFYMYTLFIVGKLASAKWLGLDLTLLVKLPPMLADAATAYLIYRLSAKRIKADLGIVLAAMFLFNPAIILNSTLWGMVDSFFMLLVIAAIVLIIEGKVECSVIFFASAVLMKPQGIFFLPVLLFELLKRRSLRTFARSCVLGLITSLAILLPFSIGQDPLWIFKLYLNTASGYTLASLNAYNLFSLLGANMRPDADILFLFSYKAWGLVFDALLVVYAGFVYLKGRHAANPMLIALVINAGAFVLSSRMHERYMYPVVALALLLVAYLKDMRLLVIYPAATAIVFLNTNDVLSRAINLGSPHIPADDVFLFCGSLMNVLLFAYILKFSYDTMLEGRLLPIPGIRGGSGPEKKTAGRPPSRGKVHGNITGKA